MRRLFFLPEKHVAEVVRALVVALPRPAHRLDAIAVLAVFVGSHLLTGEPDEPHETPR